METAIILLLIAGAANIIFAWRAFYTGQITRKFYKKLKGSRETENKRVIEMYEYIKTRAATLKNVKDMNPLEPFPLWVNIWEIHHILSMYHNGTLEKFLKGLHNGSYDSWGFDADDFKLPEFPEKEDNNDFPNIPGSKPSP
jgi:hypothetical protein